MTRTAIVTGGASGIGRAIASGKASPAAASFIKLGLGLKDPERAAIAMEIAGRAAVAWRAEGDDGHTAALNLLNGRVYAIAGGEVVSGGRAGGVVEALSL